MYHCCFIQVVGFITSQDERFHRIPVTSSLISSSRALRRTRINWVIPPALAIAFCNTPITQYSDGQEMICEIYFTQERQLSQPYLVICPCGPSAVGEVLQGSTCILLDFWVIAVQEFYQWRNTIQTPVNINISCLNICIKIPTNIR